MGEHTAWTTALHKHYTPCSLIVSKQFPSLGNELSMQAWTLRKLMLSYICGCLYTEFISQIWKLVGNSEWTSHGTLVHLSLSYCDITRYYGLYGRYFPYVGIVHVAATLTPWNVVHGRLSGSGHLPGTLQ